jgi:IS5 family transposase
MSDSAIEGALYEIASMPLFADLSLDKPIPDHTAIMNFRHLLEEHKLSRQLFKEVNKWLSDPGIYLKESTFLDATISSTKYKNKEIVSEMHQTQKGKQRIYLMEKWCFMSTVAGYRDEKSEKS